MIWPLLVRRYTEKTSGPSLALAEAVRDALVEKGYTPSTYAGRNGLNGRRDLGTLNRSAAPAVIVELGNMRNRGDDALLSSAAERQRMAEAVADGFEAWVGEG